MLLLSIIAGTTQDVNQINRIFVQSALKPTWWGEQAEKNGRKGNSDWAGYYIRKAIYSCKTIVWTTAGWKPIAMFYPDENPRYSDDDIGISTLFCDIFRHTLLKCKENDSWYVYDGVKWTLNNELAMEYCKAFVVVLTHYAKEVERADMETFPPEDTSETGRKRASKGHPYVAYIKRAASRRARETILSDAKSVSDMSISKAVLIKMSTYLIAKMGRLTSEHIRCGLTRRQTTSPRWPMLRLRREPAASCGNSTSLPSWMVICRRRSSCKRPSAMH